MPKNRAFVLFFLGITNTNFRDLAVWRLVFSDFFFVKKSEERPLTKNQELIFRQGSGRCWVDYQPKIGMQLRPRWRRWFAPR